MGPPHVTRRTAFEAGARDIAAMIVGIIPFGLIAGVAAIEAGLPAAQAIAASPMIFAGAAQLATMDLLGAGSPAVVVVLTALVINSRMAMYSAALAPAFRLLRGPQKLVGAYLLTDQAFAVSVLRYARVEEGLRIRFSYYLGAAIPLWVAWQVSTVTGVILGSGLPPDLSLDFAIPLVFMALLFPAITSRTAATAAIAAGLAAVSLRGMPLNLGLLTGSCIGIAVGVLQPRRLR